MSFKKPLSKAVAISALAMVSSTNVLAAELEEVIVTAQKREQAYTDVPVAVTAFSGEVLDMAKVTEFQDLVQVSPSLTISQSGDNRGTGVLIRGIGTTSFVVAVEPTVSTVVDGVVMGRTAQFITDLADIERVEILRGPQGTLFGKNASAGVINVISKRPTDEFQASVRGSMTDDNGWSTNAFVSGGLTDNMRARVAAYKKEWDGLGKNLYTGNDMNGDESWGVRGKLDIDLTENVNLYLIADYSEQDRNCCSWFLSNSESPFYLWDYDQYGISLDNNKYNNKTIDEKDGFSDTETSGVSAELNFEFDNWAFTSITAYREFELETDQGVDSLPYTEPTLGRFLFTLHGATGLGNQEQDQFSQELRLTSTGFDKLQLTGGLFYWEQTLKRHFHSTRNLCLAPAAGAPASPDPAVAGCGFALNADGWFDAEVNFDNWAVFGQADYQITDRLIFSAGLRYTEDEINVDFVRNTPMPGLGIAPSIGPLKSDTDDSKLTGKASLQYDMTDDMMVYASYATGYKAPAIDVIFNSSQERLDNPVPAEETTAYEIGMKGEFFDNSLRLGLTAFYTEFENLQSQTVPPGEIIFILASAGTAVTQGIEFDFTAKPMENLLLNGGFAYVDAFYDEFPAGPCYNGQGCQTQDLKDKQIANAPEWKMSIQGRYDIPLAMPFDAFVSSTYRWQDESPGSIDQNPNIWFDSYGVLDFTVGLEADDGRWTAHYFVKNALDDQYVDVKSDLTGLGAGNFGHYLNRDYQRYMGIEVEYNFGAL